jgi:hypothetical protein
MEPDTTNKIFTCLCTKTFDSMLALQTHIDEVSDATDFKIHGIKTTLSSTIEDGEVDD